MSNNPFPDLSDVTICAVDTINPAFAARALDISMSQCRFGDALLLTHEAVSTRARIVKIDRLQSIVAYSTFMIKQLGRYISTPWVLVVQWDGYVVDGSQWTEAFYQYDYIGARWLNAKEGIEVGNGGFSLRSSKLLKALADERFATGTERLEDVLICNTWRSVLENDYGIRFAPAELADRFSYEYAVPARPSFGFHGLINMWRHIEDKTMLEIIRDVDIQTLSSPRGVALLKIYCDLRKFACVKAIYQRYRQYWGAQEVLNAFVQIGMHNDLASHYMRICDAA
ncbi:DUF5672 family protein [Paraburkholderia pallida]|uniref:DUF5672 domain-containing protein n=1 Tax=Paraburkholderia pallida TaxID=2547399 RepID=A0A4P7D1I4_9BURK|nr:DUF5672 family protein [Paraburkholderia pallida]QBR01047.1 hypothetical protein E1956_27825 [Paraburkholderia pallida]